MLVRLRLSLGLALVAALVVHATRTADAEEPTLDPAAVRRTLDTHCASCHGPQLRRPKGRFGFVTDLHRLRRSPAFVIPGNPDASALLQEVIAGRMPPPKSDTPSMSASDTELLRTWVLAGAPAGDTPAGAPPPTPGEVGLMRRIGQFHPLCVHFPLALLLAAMLAELIAMGRRSRAYATCARYCLALGTIGAFVAGGTGWAWAIAEGHAATTHRWLGVATGLFSLGACLLVRRAHRRAATGADRWTYRIALLLAFVAVAAAGFYGGRITYGPEHHVW